MANVNDRSEAFLAQLEEQRLPHDLMGGTRGMLSAGARYIPQEPGEDLTSWKIRLERTVLLNVYRRTLRYMGGRVFEKTVRLGEEASEEFQAFTEDVDKRGRNLTVWGRKVFEQGVNDGVTFCLVDYDTVITRMVDGRPEYLRRDGQWEAKTKAADRENGWRPYFVHVPVENVLDARVEWVGRSAEVSHFRYVETQEEQNGPWDTRRYQRIRVFWLDEDGRAMWQTFRNSVDGGSDFVPENEPQALSLGVIPVAIFMPGDRRTDTTAEPALIDLAQLNKRHWQATSSQYELMEYVRRPPWFGNKLGMYDGQDGNRKIVFGPGQLCVADADGAALRSVGVDTGSVSAGRQELQDLEQSMALYGLQLLQPKTGAVTATESLRDAAENNSTLKAWALEFQDFLENCMRFMAWWQGEADGPSVLVNTEFANATNAQFLLEMQRAGVISNETFLSLVKGLGALPDDFDPAAEADRMAQGLVTNGTTPAFPSLVNALNGAGEI